MNSTGRFLCAVLALAAVTPCHEGQAQIGGLIKKKVGQAAAGQAPAAQATGQAPVFDNVILELTPPRLAQVIAAKKAGKQLATGPNSPVALRKKLDALDEQQAAIYSKHVDDINAWDAKRMDAERCRDSVLALASDRQGSTWLQRAGPLSMQVAQAQQKGDTAELRRLTEQLQRLREPTAADTVQAVKQCGIATPPAIVQQWLGIKSQMDTVNEEIAKAEQAISDAETATSGMNQRQLAMACERIQIFVDRMKAKKQQPGFTAAEIQALDQAIKDLDKLCT
jgi:hypothetical protein